MSIILFFMFAALLSDHLGPDSAMMMALAFYMAAKIVTIKEGLAGFANEGVFTVMVSNAQDVIFLLLFCVTQSAFATSLCFRCCLLWHMG
jgi:hypothetical protein